MKLDESKEIRGPHTAHPSGKYSLVLAALGIVFGDIGTSPLYAFQVIIGIAGKPTSAGALGLLSLVIWTLLIIVSLKYVTFVMRADNDGEGGILALMSLLNRGKGKNTLIIIVGLFGAALIYGDGAITPAISVLSAIEGIKVVSPIVAPFVLPVAIFVLLSLFAVQHHGTAKIGRIFGPIMTLWFIVLASMGIWGIVRYPGVLVAFNPWYGARYLLTGGWSGFLVLGGVFLAVTGAEALYADMGHIGRGPIRFAWYGLVLPALLLNYAGQTALLLAGVPVEDSIFYRLCPEPLVIPLIALATVATIIASQSIITGAFSMTRQAMQLGWCPRLEIHQTSSTGYGQIYVPAVNWLLMVVTLGLTIAFGSSDRLAAAYGIAVSLTMMLTTMLTFIVMRRNWGWNLGLALLVAGSFFCIDATFVAANFLKVLEGGWVPLALAASIFLLMATWHKGAAVMAQQIQSLAMPIDYFSGYMVSSEVARVPGTAVFLTRSVMDTPPIIIWHVWHSRALHQTAVALTLLVEPVPYLSPDRRVEIQDLLPGIWRVTARYGYMDKLDIPAITRQIKNLGCGVDLNDITYYVGHETIIHNPTSTAMSAWQVNLYSFMYRNCVQISEYLSLPRDAVVELGRQIEL